MILDIIGDVNILAWLCATVAGMVIGAVWYLPQTFGKAWMEEVGYSEEDMQEGATKKMSISLLVTAIQALVIYLFVGIDAGLGEGLLRGFLLGDGIAVATLFNNQLFEGRSLRHMMINGFHNVIAISVMGAIIGFMG